MSCNLEERYNSVLLDRIKTFEEAVVEAARMYDGFTPDEIAALVWCQGGHADEAATDRVGFVLRLLDSHRSNLRGDVIL